MSLKTGKFAQRNSFYLRISPSTVLQLLLLLDSRHVEWMSSEILEKVLSVLRTHISTKLGAESMTMSKKRREADSEKIDVFRGAGWQMAYYFRVQAHKHAVLLKNKDITFEPFSKENPRPAPAEPSSRSRKRRRKAVEIRDEDSSGDEAEGSEAVNEHEDSLPPVKQEEDEGQAPLFRPDFGNEDDEDEKPDGKPKLRVSYNGFSIFGKLLVVIVEPYPPLRGQSIASLRPDERELSVAPSVRGGREASEFSVPNDPSASEAPRFRSESISQPLRSAANPLFRPETPLPDDDEDLDGFRERSQSILGYNPTGRGLDEEETDTL